MVVHIKGQEDGCCHDDHRQDDACQETDLQPLLAVSCALLVSCWREGSVTLEESDSVCVLQVMKSGTIKLIMNFPPKNYTHTPMGHNNTYIKLPCYELFHTLFIKPDE